MTLKQTPVLKSISPDIIRPNHENPRLFFRSEELDNLLFSISRQGIQVPITVYKEQDHFYLIDGERRWRCALKLNLRRVPALIQDKPTPLENLLLMYNIHALREQWDYFTIAAKLPRVIELFNAERGYEPNEIELSEGTGLTRGQIRRCRLLLDLPEKYKEDLYNELQLPKKKQRLSEDLFIEMEKALKTVNKRFPEFVERIDLIRNTLIDKYKGGVIRNVTDFRNLAKIATSVDNLEIQSEIAVKSLRRIFENNNDVSIDDEYEMSFEFQYDERKAIRQIEFLDHYIGSALEDEHEDKFDEEFLVRLRELYEKLKRLLED